MIKETLKKLKKNDQVFVVYGMNQDNMTGYVQEVTEENLTLLDYVPDVLIKIPVNEIHEIAIKYKSMETFMWSDNMTLRLRLKELLKERGISQKELAEMAGLTEAQVSIIAANRTQTINRDHLFKIAIALNEKEFDRLFEWHDQNFPKQ